MKKYIVAAMLVAGLSTQAAVTYIDDDITNSVTLSALPTGDYYSLTNRVTVEDGASLTLEAGVIFKNSLDGTLAVARGGQLFVQGVSSNPVIFTSTSDDMENWRLSANEWGSIAIMGRGYTSAHKYDGIVVSNSAGVANTATPSGSNERDMEGLDARFGGDIAHYHGGNDDMDDSGSIEYLSIRYGGMISSLPNKELNGLSLGCLGAATDIDFVEVMNNVDDGIEIWGGKVNLKHVNIWNIGDDSFDVDGGWRGKAQYGLIVQGASLTNGLGKYGTQGSGLGDNCIEIDGAEDVEAQPVTTTVLANFTVIGMGSDGDGDRLFCPRDGARVQFRNCIFMEGSEKTVGFDDKTYGTGGDPSLEHAGNDGDGASGYGANGTLLATEVYATPYNQIPTNNMGDISVNALYYGVQTEGNLAGFYDCVFYNNDTYTYFNQLGQTNVVYNNTIALSSPIALLTRSGDYTVNREDKVFKQVVAISPIPQGDALGKTNTSWAVNDSFFDAANYAGAFNVNENWLAGWSAADAYGFIATNGIQSVSTTTIDPAVKVSFPTQVGSTYTVEKSTDSGSTWTVFTTVAGNGATQYIADDTDDGSAWYRAVVSN